MRIVHLLASPFVGGPERQVLGLARHVPPDVTTHFLSFAERGLANAFLDEARGHGFHAQALRHNTPRFFASIREIADVLRQFRADLLCTSGYKPDLLGWCAARRAGIPVIAIAHGWTGATWKVRLYERADAWVMRRMDAVVCVAQAQAPILKNAGIPEAKLHVIQNAIGADAFTTPDAETRAELASWFASPPRWIVGAAGRLSPEKGFAVFLDAAARIVQQRADVGFVLFGDGPLRSELDQLIAVRNLRGRFVLAGFRPDVARFLPNLDVAVMSSFTEGLPVILLETSAAAVPTVATQVGGIPEVITDGVTGFLVAPGDAVALAERILALLGDDARRQQMGAGARERVRREFSFTRMSAQYHELFKKVLADK